MGKEEIARNKQFLLFQQCFLLNQIIVSTSVHIFDIISLFAAELEQPKIGIPGKGLSQSFHTSCYSGILSTFNIEGSLRSDYSSYTLSSP